MQLRGSVAVVTGASSGIGRATALALAREGAQVVVSARRKDRLDDLEREISSGNGRALAVPCDVTDPDEIRRLAAVVDGAFGRCDVLVNNAGIPAGGRFVDIDWKKIEDVIDTNLMSVLAASKAFLPGMLRRHRGHIINVASLAGRHAVPGSGVYSATKHAVVAFSESTNHETAPQGVLMTAVNPGLVDTEGFPQRDLPSPIVMDAERVAAAIVRVVRRGQAPVVSVPRWSGGLELVRMLAPRPYRAVSGRLLLGRQRDR
jgi:short-subunit dehydrogenase